jgi:hypothetical protein
VLGGQLAGKPATVSASALWRKSQMMAQELRPDEPAAKYAAARLPQNLLSRTLQNRLGAPLAADHDAIKEQQNY